MWGAAEMNVELTSGDVCRSTHANDQSHLLDGTWCPTLISSLGRLGIHLAGPYCFNCKFDNQGTMRASPIISTSLNPSIQTLSESHSHVRRVISVNLSIFQANWQWNSGPLPLPLDFPPGNFRRRTSAALTFPQYLGHFCHSFKDLLDMVFYWNYHLLRQKKYTKIQITKQTTNNNVRKCTIEIIKDYSEPRCGQHFVAICMCHEHVGAWFGDRAFAFAAPRVWNSLPTDIKLHRSTTSFKRRLKTVLFNRGFAEYM